MTVIDLACFSQRLIIEVDGVQHEWAEDKAKDAVRDAHLSWLGFNVLRFSNSDVMENSTGVVEVVIAALGAAVRQD